jgi:hypothetical protein
MIEKLREHTDAPVHAIVYSHGHHGYNSSVPLWQAHNAERGDPPARLVAQENVHNRYARYRETNGLQLRMAAMQFPSRQPIPLEVLEPGFTLHDPTETFADEMTLVEGARRIELIWAPSETDDELAVWLPDDGLLLGGAATPGFTIPNTGTPLRTQRFTIRRRFDQRQGSPDRTSGPSRIELSKIGSPSESAIRSALGLVTGYVGERYGMPRRVSSAGSRTGVSASRRREYRVHGMGRYEAPIVCQEAGRGC